MLGWRNGNVDFGFEKRPEKMCSPMYGVCGRDGEMGVVGMPVQEEHSQIDLPQHVNTARGSQIQAESRGSVCESDS